MTGASPHVLLGAAVACDGTGAGGSKSACATGPLFSATYGCYSVRRQSGTAPDLFGVRRSKAHAALCLGRAPALCQARRRAARAPSTGVPLSAMLAGAARGRSARGKRLVLFGRGADVGVSACDRQLGNFHVAAIVDRAIDTAEPAMNSA